MDSVGRKALQGPKSISSEFPLSVSLQISSNPPLQSQNRMLKKNPSQRRFNTAAARIMLSSKLPSDFFAPSRQKQGRESSLYSHRHQDAESYPQPTIKKDPLMFTFHRSSSQDHLKHRKILPSHGAPKLFAIARKSQPKLPPLSLLLPKGEMKQSTNTNWFKGFASSKDKLKKLARVNTRLIEHTSVQETKQAPPLR